jgi:carbon-monoxide dehydrogenase large subunit
VKTASTPTGWIGRPVRRFEDERFIAGTARYVADLSVPGMAHLVIVRSPHAHARLRSVDVERARGSRGVIAAITAGDLEGRITPMALDARDGAVVEAVPHPLLSGGKARYVGDPIVAILAETPADALDAAERVSIDYEPLQAVVDARGALRGDVLVHEHLPDNVVVRWHRASGDVAGAFGSAARVVSGRFHVPRLVAAPLEGRGTLAVYDRGTDRLTVWTSNQSAHGPRAGLARMLQRHEETIRVIVPDVGGGFGAKGALAPETALAAFLAVEYGRPVRWIETRTENFLASYQGRGMDVDVEFAVSADGRILGAKGRVIGDLGAYLHPPSSFVPVTVAMLATGMYDVGAAEFEVLGVATNKAGTGPYRGAGRPEAAFVAERMIDLIARDLEIDPVDLRRRNYVAAAQFPYQNPMRITYDSGRYHEALDRAIELFDYAHWREEQRRARAEGRCVGVAVASYVERAGSGNWESASVVVNPNGRVVVRSGATPQGQGHETTFAQIAADYLGIHPRDVVVEHGDSSAIPRGIGTFGSRSTTIAGSAIVRSLEKVRAKASQVAAHLLEAAPADIVWDHGTLHVRGIPSRAVTFNAVAAAAYDPFRLGPDLEMGLDALSYFTMQGPVFPYGVYAAAVEIERDTGELRILKLVALDDPGRIINPLLAEGQVMGSIAQGLGAALVEAVTYDEDGQVRTSTFVDYALPRATDMPPIVSEFMETPSPLNPLGAKGVGESGSIGTPAVIANAVADALAPFGVRHVDMPLTPMKLWRLIHGADGNSSTSMASAARGDV